MRTERGREREKNLGKKSKNKIPTIITTTTTQMHRNQHYTQRERWLYSWPAESSYEPEFNTEATTPHSTQRDRKLQCTKDKGAGSDRVESSRVKSSWVECGEGGWNSMTSKSTKLDMGRVFVAIFFFFNFYFFPSFGSVVYYLLHLFSSYLLQLKNKLWKIN